MSEFITPEVNIPQRNISNELSQIFNFQSRYAQPYYDLEARFGPLYNRLNVRNLGDQTRGFDDNGIHVPGTIELGREGTAANRNWDLTDVESMGPRVIAADLNANPFLANALARMDAAETPSPLLTELNRQAGADLTSGGYLSPEAERANRETTRSAWSDRGLGHTDQAAIDELMNREAIRSGRVAASRKFAGDVEGLNQTMRDYIGRSTQIAGTALPDIWQALLSRTSGSGGGGGGANQTPIGQYTRVFDPTNPYFQDLFSSNQNAAATEAIGNAQNQAATRAAIASIFGGMAGAGIARSDVRSKENIKEIGTVRISNGAEVPRYEFSYRAGCVPKGLRGDRAYIGVMSDDIKLVMPAAVVVDPVSGFEMVNYAMLGIEMEAAA